MRASPPDSAAETQAGGDRSERPVCTRIIIHHCLYPSLSLPLQPASSASSFLRSPLDPLPLFFCLHSIKYAATASMCWMPSALMSLPLSEMPSLSTATTLPSLSLALPSMTLSVGERGFCDRITELAFFSLLGEIMTLCFL